MSYKFADLRALSDDALIEAHDHAAQHASWGVRDYLDEFARRRAEAQADTLTQLTWAICALTAVNVVAVLVDVL